MYLTKCIRSVLCFCVFPFQLFCLEQANWFSHHQGKHSTGHVSVPRPRGRWRVAGRHLFCQCACEGAARRGHLQLRFSPPGRYDRKHTQTHTHLRDEGFPSLWYLTAVFFFVCAFKHQFSHKETNVDPPNFPFIYIYVCSYKQIRTLKNMHLITENKKQTRPDWISSGFGLKWGLKLVVEPLADVLLLLFLHQCNKQFWKSSSCDVRNVVISSPAVGWSFFFWALFLTLTPKCRSV